MGLGAKAIMGFFPEDVCLMGDCKGSCFGLAKGVQMKVAHRGVNAYE